MVVTESYLLSNFLLPPASLSVSLTLQQFTELFPASRQDDPTIAVLHRELQKQRAQDIERVKQNITAEVKHGELQQRHIKRIRRARQNQELGNDSAELTMEAELFPENSNEKQRQAHSMESIVPELESAITDLEDEINGMEKEAAQILAELQSSIGDLSDLRYGRFSKTPGTGDRDLSTEVIESLRCIRQLCGDAEQG